MILFPLFSSIVFLITIYLLTTRKLFSRSLCIIIYAFLSVSWCLLLGFCGDDMDTYLSFFEKYSFKDFTFYSPLEFSVGLLSSFLKLFLPFFNGKGIANSYRILVFSLIPLWYIFKTYSSRHSTYLFISFSVFLFLFPYSFLSGANMINNGLSITFTSYFLIIYVINHFFNPKNNQGFISFDQFLLLFLASFAHFYGLGLIFILISSIIGFKILKSSRLFYFGTRFPNLINATLFAFPFFCAAPLLGVSFLNYTLKDNTVLLSASILFACLFVSGLNMRLIFKISNQDQSFFSKNFLNNISLMFLCIIGISLFAITLGLLGGGAAAERFIGSFIGYNLLFSLTLFLISTSFLSNYSKSDLSPIHINKFSLTRSILLGLFIIFSLNLYFYNSKAFFANVGNTC